MSEYMLCFLSVCMGFLFIFISSAITESKWKSWAILIILVCSYCSIMSGDIC